MRLKNRVFFLVLALSLAAGLVVPAQSVRAYGSVSVSFFYDSLAPYGDWVTVSSYGRCWHPRHVAVGWQPYLHGKWIYTDAGWTWVSFDPWGGNPYHYGTWVHTASYGWIWVPGTIWAPAWVTWYITDDAFGWAPVPPSFVVGISGYAGPAVTLSRSAYVFVPARQFSGVNVSSVRVPAAQNATFIARSRPQTRFAVQGGVLSSGGPPVSQVERVAGRRIQRASLAQAKTQPVPIRTSLQGGRGRAAVVVPASERAKLISTREREAPQQVSRTKPEAVKTDRAVRTLPPPAQRDKHERATGRQISQSPPPAASSEKRVRTVHSQSAQPSNEKHENATVHRSPPPVSNVKQERAVHSPPPPPPSNNRPEKATTQAQLSQRHNEGNAGRQTQAAPPPHVERQPNVQPKAQSAPPPAKANPPAKEKEKEHGKEN